MADLQTVVSAYMRPIAERKLLSTADRRAIFSNIEALSGCAAALLEELSEDKL